MIKDSKDVPDLTEFCEARDDECDCDDGNIGRALRVSLPVALAMWGVLGVLVFLVVRSCQ